MIRTAAVGLVLVSVAMWACSASNGTSPDASGTAGAGGGAGGLAGEADSGAAIGGRGGNGSGGGTTGGRGGSNGGPGGIGSSAGGVGGAGAGGTGAWNGCLQPVAPGVYMCAGTYDEQLAKSCGGGRADVTGACGTGWGWRCRNIYVQDCVYDSQKKLVAARWCEDVPACGGIGGGDSSFCRQTSPSVGTCIEDIGRPATGCAPAGSDAGTRCCGDGTLPPTGPPFFCQPTYTEQLRAGRCARAGRCGDLLVTSDSSPSGSYSGSCHYNSMGALVSAFRCDSPQDMYYCGIGGTGCIRSALAGGATAYVEPPCSSNWATSSCGSSDAGRD